MRHAAEMKFRGGIEAFPIETIEERSGSSAVKAAVVKTEPYAGHVEPKRAFLATVRIFRGAKLLTMQVGHSEVKRKSTLTKREAMARLRVAEQRLNESIAKYSARITRNALRSTITADARRRAR